ncbi:efflux transporter outer membrane subunit [Oleiagrimonas soli]|uniref:Multidrug efflux system outer membrane protein n=1 Tax=Oleiagrimonas soli TaxID=1543381 RepID=A0A099CZG8_9GAMM|nr:efflux transporter outer membrane subunit [Oleiagrimonas soli]KGI78420.1 RND transporter [Oleiagrimonas soli]MBB6183439.1 multidrug efflux system outer membrane protein [Oleiagrimonas soli]
MTPPRVFAVALATLLLGACVGVPDKIRHTDLRTQAPLAGLPVSGSQSAWPDADWWKRYRDPQLDRLIDDALRDATSLAAARSRVSAARASAKLTAAQVGLRINGNVQVARQRLSENGLIPSKFLGFTWYNQGDVGVQGSYDFDLWGGNRAAVQAAIGQVRAAAAERSAAALALQVGITRTYFGWQADQHRLQLAEQLVRDQTRLVHVLDVRVKAGLEPNDRLQQARASVAAARQQVAALRGSAQIRRAVLAALIGIAPKQLPELKVRPLPAANTTLPADAGLDLIARRPDIAARRWQVESALRQTDAARAQFFPDFSLSAMAGFSSIDLGKLLHPESRVFALTPALHLPIFEGGLLRAGYGVSKAQLQAAVAQYNDAVVNAAREVSTQVLDLQRLRAQRHEQQAQLQAVSALQGNAEARQRQGLTDIQPVLQARAQVLQQRDARLQLTAQVLDADVGLIQALGGGYHLEHAPATADDTTAPAPATSSARKPTL